MKVKIQDESLSVIIMHKELFGKQQFPLEVIEKFKQRIFQITEAKDTRDLRNIKSLHFEKLRAGRYKGKYAIRLTLAYRMIFTIEKEEIHIEVILVEEINNHYA